MSASIFKNLLAPLQPMVAKLPDTTLPLPVKTAARPNTLVVAALVSVYTGGPSAAPVNMLNLSDTF